jgi:integrase/recombinase XerD
MNRLYCSNSVTQNRDFIREYLSYCRVEKGLSTNSISSYETDLDRLSVWVGAKGLEMLSLTRADLREWMIDLGGQKLSENTKRRLVSAVRGFYKFLVFDGHIQQSPAEDIVSPQKGLYLPRYLSTAEIELLLGSIDTSTFSGLRDRSLVELMYASGLRVSEAITLRLGDIDLDAGILETTGKGGKTRRVPVGSAAIEWVKSYLSARRSREDASIDHIFVSPEGRPLSRRTVYDLISGYAEKCGLEGVSPHTLRHSFATHLVQNNADIRSVQQMLGHADISTTQIYTHITSSHLKRRYDTYHPRSRSKS